uniref:Uncharacterized protein n=1 Tax=Heterorhabditis bacteriophora TaxID=37862 RepID=A0A1I7WX22_HETBA
MSKDMRTLTKNCEKHLIRKTVESASHSITSSSTVELLPSSVNSTDEFYLNVD